MRIGYVSVGDPNEISAWSGIPFHILGALRNLGASVEVIGPLSRLSSKLLILDRTAGRLAGVRVLTDRFPIMLSSYARQIERRIRNKSLDVIFSTSSIPITHLRCTEPVVTYCDALFTNMMDYYPEFSNLSKKTIANGKKQECLALRVVSDAAYASSWAADEARKLTNDPCKIRIIPFGANLPVAHDLEAVKGFIRARRNLRPSSCILLFAGVDWRRKGGDVAVETARILNETGLPTKLWIVGCTPPISLPSFVECFGFVSKNSPDGRDRLRRLYEEADMFLLPSRAEAAGVVFCEASAYGLPILTTDTGGIQTYVTNDANGFRLPAESNGRQFAEAVRAMVLNPDVYSRFALCGFNEYQKRLNWRAAARDLLDMFQQAVNRRNRS
jgi:glycosyltransferase involved in cell wall biosynthesis